MIQIPDAAKPYVVLAKWIVLALLVLGLVGVGCSIQKGRDAEKLVKAEQAISVRTDALHAAAGALRQARNVFQSISAMTRANAEEAKNIQTQGEASAAVARRDAATYKRQLAIAEQLLQDERENCTEGRARICGTPLR